jgi:ribosomal protein S12 methylthiotransferase
MPEKNKVGFISLGCPKALVDSERILTQLRIDGYSIVPNYDDADIVVVNTCGFIDSAKEESLQAIGEAIDENGKVIVTGCLGKQAELITNSHPKVLGVTGPQAYEEVVSHVHRNLPPPAIRSNPFTDLVPPQGIKLTPRHYAYLKISEGCNHRCSFCIIPSMRGDLVSRPVGNVLDEAERLVKSGVKELLVISQDTSAYGVDTKYQTGFWQGRPIKASMQGLCEALAELGVWVRLHYVYPYPHVDQIIPLMADKKILPYLDIPFQHASINILNAMRRPATTEKSLQRIESWRITAPDLTIRSTFIVGFPGETDQDFEILLEFLREARLDRVGCFQYSAVNGAKANDLPNQVPEKLKEERWQRFMETQQQISTEQLAKKIGHTISVIIDEEVADGYIGRSTADAPEIDGLVYFNSPSSLNIGEILDVAISSSDEYDLYGHAKLK